MPSTATAASGHDRRLPAFLGDDYALNESDEETVDDGFEGEEVGDHVKTETQESNALPNLNGGPAPAAAVADGGYATPQRKRPRAEVRGTPGSGTTEARRPPAAVEDSRRLFQRLWTDEDEIVILQGFLDFNKGRHHDTRPFYDQIRARLQLDFNKNQLVEKLRRLKKKYRNVTNRMGSSRDYAFKNPHDQATFELSRQIWGYRVHSRGGADDDDLDLNPHPIVGGGVDRGEVAADPRDRPRKRRRGGKRSAVEVAAVEAAEATVILTLEAPVEVKVAESHMPTAMASVPNVVQETVSNPLHSTAVGDEKWRNQQILELEVFAKRLELVQEQIKSRLRELRSAK